MRTALDTNIISGLLSQESSAAEISLHLARCKREGTLVISPVVYAELFAHPNATEALLEYFFARTGIELDSYLDASIWTEAGRRYAQYAARRRKSTSNLGPRRILADFVIGAHALNKADHLMTFDINVFQTDFPDLRLYGELLS